VSGCTTTAGAVNSQSASTTLRPTTATAAPSPLRCAIQPWKAVPRPVPNSRVALTTWTYFRRR
jgi:hypothetical protein